MKKFVLVAGLLLAGFFGFCDEYDGQCDLPAMNEWLSNMGFVDEDGMPSMEAYEEYILQLAKEGTN